MPAQPPTPADMVEAAASLWSRAGQQHWVPVAGNSMLPWLRPGDQLLVDHTAGPLRRGDVVVLRQGGGLLAHRLLRAEPWTRPQRLWTQGDHNRQPDAPVETGMLLGRAVAIQHGGRTVRLDGPRWRAVNWLVAVSLLGFDQLVQPGRLAWPRRALGRAGRRLLSGFEFLACR